MKGRRRPREKMAQANGEFVAVLWHQGETDAAKVPVIVGEIGRWMRNDGDHAAKVNPAIHECTNRVENCACVSSEGLKNQDQHHFDGPSVKTLGDRYYEAWKSQRAAIGSR